MGIQSFVRRLKSSSAHQPSQRRRSMARLRGESLEDRRVLASLTIGDVAVMEGTSGTTHAAVVVSLSESSKRPVTVYFSTLDSTALVGSDYEATSGKLNFAKGETSKTILVPIYGDRSPEWDEQLVVRLSRARGATIADSEALVTIRDSSPRLSVSSEYGVEGTTMTFTVALLGTLTESLTVEYFTYDGAEWPGDPWAAYADSDYVPASGTLTFTPGETSKSFTVEILADGEPEYDEYFYVSLLTSRSDLLVFEGFGYIDGELEWPAF